MSGDGSRDRGVAGADSTESPQGPWVATTGRDAVNATERRICGTGAVGTASRAEGFAMAGRPAATLIDHENAGAQSGTAAVADTAWVHHRIDVAGPMARKGFAVELVAGNAQEAVDHCLVAHRIARTLGRPCLCTLPAGIADEPAFVRLPDRHQIPALLSAASADYRAPRDVAHRAFEFVSEQTGRAGLCLATEGVDDAEYLLIALGDSRAAAQRIAAEIRGNGVLCGVVGVAMVEPFPLEAMADLLAGKRAVVVVSSGNDIAAAELSAWVRSTSVRTPGVTVSAVSLCGESTRERADTLTALGVTTDDAPPEAMNLPARKRVVLGVSPASEWAESFLRGVAARLRNVGPVTLLRPEATLDDTAVLAIGDEGYGVPATESLDVLLAPDLAALGGGRGLEALAPNGTALLYCDPDRDPSSASELSAAQRAALVLREVRLFRLRRKADALPEPEDRAPFDTLLSGALHAAFPALGELVGQADAPSFVTEIEATDGPEAALLRQGAASLEALDAAALDAELEESQKASGAAVPSQMDDSPGPGPEGAGTSPTPWSEALRHFHLTGEGAHSTAEPPPSVSLLPLALETLDAGNGPRYPITLDTGEAQGLAVELEPATLLQLYAKVNRAGRGRLRSEFADRARRLAWRLGELLGYPDAQGPAGPSAKNLAGSLGAVTGDFFDADKLSSMLPRRTATDLPPARRERIERVWRTLDAFVNRDGWAREMIVVHAPGMAGLPDDPAFQEVSHEDGLRAAIGIFDSLALIDALRAARIAEIETRHAYDETIHDRLFARFDWQSFSAEELLLLPQVVVLESGARLRGPSLAALSELLRSGRPIHVLVAEHLAELSDSGDQSLSGYHAGLGHLTVAHREAFVLQSSLGTPHHLVGGLQRMVMSLSPSVALVATPDWHAAVPPLLQLEAAHAGRATPTFLFDPSAGETWSERFDLTGNPQVEVTWPRGSVRYLDAEGREQSREETLTFAHAAALLGTYRKHFRVIPANAMDADQVEIAEWLELPDKQAFRRLPFIWIRGGGGRMARAVLTRELAFACRDRARTWRLFEGLAGASAAPAEAAAETSLPGATAPLAARPFEERATDLEAANQVAVRAAMQRLVQSLIDPNGETLPAALLTTPTVAAEPSTPAAVVAAPEPVAAPVGDPYIDTPLCTTCNECINLNNRLFVYDENKQARIGDASTGTFKQLVAAAEKCPARCIHPGAPRPGDKSATEALIARAEPFQ